MMNATLLSLFNKQPAVVAEQAPQPVLPLYHAGRIMVVEDEPLTCS